LEKGENMKKLLVVLAIFLAITIIFCSSNAYSKRTIQCVESYGTLEYQGKQKKYYVMYSAKNQSRLESSIYYTN
jgi:hypothetical protein